MTSLRFINDYLYSHSMVDLGWLADTTKIVGGGVVGWVSRVFTERSQQRKVRLRLYREFLANYFALRHGVDYWEARKGQDPPMGGFRHAIGRMTWDYYDHAHKNQDVYSDLPEASGFNAFYEEFKRVEPLRENRGSNEESLLADADYITWSIENGFHNGTFGVSFAKKALGSKEYGALTTRLVQRFQKKAQPDFNA